MSRFRPKQETPSDETIGDDLLVIVDRSVNPYLVVFHDPTSFRAEQIRALRNQLVAMNPDGSAKTLVVTSAIKGEGKSITTINLALAFAELERHSVLLVDADLRGPSVEDYLNLNPRPGLSDVLLDRVRLSDAIRHAGVRNLDVLGAGTRLTSPSEILTTTRFQDLFARLKEDYRYVIIDTPPVLSATDASVIAARADGTLLTVRLEHSPKALTKQAIRNLQDLGANVLGVFVTEVRGTDPDNDPRFAYRTAEEL
ncbi:MAG: CpsD/CapB family tyrosine-protein kinase [Planctomycetes bacterium]|nr:CpsD/CapB family tyrosine-protein kinase [Planctomycetota bacterium]